MKSQNETKKTHHEDKLFVAIQNITRATIKGHCAQQKNQQLISITIST